MNRLTQCLVQLIDGTQFYVELPEDICRCGITQAPIWLLDKLGIVGEADWFLSPLINDHLPENCINGLDEGKLLRLHLSRKTMAAATPRDPRQTRLKDERTRLERLNRESDYVRVEPLEVLAGSEPEHYRVTFQCRGIIGISPSQEPIFGHEHMVELRCDDDFPSDVPRLRWVTPIWHPNIQHNEPKSVCVNKAEWLGGMRIEDLCRQMFEMVQYKNYHAESTPPYPLDRDVARWVLEYAEPRGIVNKRQNISVDDKPFTKPTSGMAVRIRLLQNSSIMEPSLTESQPSSRIKLIKPNETPKIKLIPK